MAEVQLPPAIPCSSPSSCLSLNAAGTKFRLPNAVWEESLTLQVSKCCHSSQSVNLGRGTGTSSLGISFHPTAASSGTAGTELSCFS